MTPKSVFAKDLLVGKVALVTGGGSGIGRGIAELFAAHGAKVALVGRRQEKLDETRAHIEAAGGAALSLPCDVRDFDRVTAAVRDTVAAFGRLDVVVSGAAGNFPVPAAALSPNGFKSVVDIDLLGTFHVCRAAFEPLSKQGGSIVCITATQSFVPTALQAHVGAAKAGIEMLSRDLALEWGPMGIRVNTIAPGPVGGTEGMSRLAPGDMADTLKASLPLRRFATIDEVAHGVLYLVSPAAAYVTGAMLLMDGGTSMLGGRFL